MASLVSRNASLCHMTSVGAGGEQVEGQVEGNMGTGGHACDR